MKAELEMAERGEYEEDEYGWHVGAAAKVHLIIQDEGCDVIEDEALS